MITIQLMGAATRVNMEAALAAQGAGNDTGIREIANVMATGLGVILSITLVIVAARLVRRLLARAGGVSVSVVGGGSSAGGVPSALEYEPGVWVRRYLGSGRGRGDWERARKGYKLQPGDLVRHSPPGRMNDGSLTYMPGQSGGGAR